MASAKFPPVEKRKLIGKRIDRADGPAKSTGAAKYSYDINRPGMLYAKLVTSPHAHAKVESVDASEASAMTGVEAVWKDDALIGTDQEIQYAGQIIAAVAARTEEIATEAAHRVKVKYHVLPHQVVDTDPAFFSPKDKPAQKNSGNVDTAFASPDVVTVSGEYGIPVITHCCLEPHGQVTEIRDGELYIWPSTQNVSRFVDARLSEDVGIDLSKMHVDCQYMGGGFGAKFNYDKWGTIGAKLSKDTGKAVKLMLDRDLELMIAGTRPSAFSKFKIGATKDGKVTALAAEVWGTGGGLGWSVTNVVPYVFTKIPNVRVKGMGIRTNRGGARAWRAPNHPQACFLTMSALEDAAAAVNMDALEFFLKNLDLTDRANIYREELQIAADLIGYKQKAHPRGDKTPGPIKRGLGISMHTWGGRGHPSNCEVTINADGSVEAKIGTQDLGTGTRTTIAMVIAETLGVPLETVRVNIGKSEYPQSGGSGGSTTIGGVSVSSLKAATEALNALLAKVAPKLGVAPEALEAADGKIREIAKPANAIAWKDACATLRQSPITKRGENVPGEAEKEGLISQGVGGVQIADISVDMETGVVTLNEMVAVQDCGLIIDLKTAESQVYGALIMGVAYSLFEEVVFDAHTGAPLNADMEFYRLSGLKDIGKLKVHMMMTKEHDNRGIIGLGEPPVISPGAAIANAVANACGVRVPNLPLTPDHVIAALQKGGLI